MASIWKKTRKSIIDQILVSVLAYCPRCNEHVGIKKVANSNGYVILERCHKTKKCLSSSSAYLIPGSCSGTTTLLEQPLWSKYMLSESFIDTIPYLGGQVLQEPIRRMKRHLQAKLVNKVAIVSKQQTRSPRNLVTKYKWPNRLHKLSRVTSYTQRQVRRPLE